MTDPSSGQTPGAQAGGDAALLAARHLIQVYAGALAPERCREIIARFERNPHRHDSRTHGGTISPGRTGTQLEMANQPGWADLEQVIAETSMRCLRDYARRFQAIEFLLKPCRITLTSPIVERVDPGQGFDWHIDAGPPGTSRRFLSTLFYLNDIADGGTTDFPMQGISIRPSAGTLVMFPPFWTYPHRGASPVNAVKYKMTAYFEVEQ